MLLDFPTTTLVLRVKSWLLQLLSQDYNLAAHTTYVAFVNFIHEWRGLQFNVDTERQIFEKIFMLIFIFSQSICQKSAER